jgi:hypothetical protein
MTYEYTMGDSDQRFSFPKDQKTYGENWSLIADELAQDYFDNHDGWESSWPQSLRIWKGEEQVAAFNIEMEREPVFYCYDIIE